jgi:hypothetical protein
MRFYRLPSAVLTGALALALAGCGAHKVDVAQTVRTNLEAPGRPAAVLAVYEGWFGMRDHISVGYDCHDRSVLGRQIEQARSLGISGFVADWYGLKKPFLDRTFELLEQEAAARNFKVALMYDELRTQPNSTEDTIAGLDYAYQRYIGPQAPYRDAYLRYQGRPIIFIWPNTQRTDWDAVRQHIQGWPEQPIIVYKMMSSPTQYGTAFDGYYLWINPGRRGWQPDGSNWGGEYLKTLYSESPVKYPGKLIVGAAWPGFDDHRASWSEHRYMSFRCGKTLQDTMRSYWDYSRSTDSSPFLLIATWNDYEEGTAIERGIAEPSAEHSWANGDCH